MIIRRSFVDLCNHSALKKMLILTFYLRTHFKNFFTKLFVLNHISTKCNRCKNCVLKIRKLLLKQTMDSTGSLQTPWRSLRNSKQIKYLNSQLCNQHNLFKYMPVRKHWHIQSHILRSGELLEVWLHSIQPHIQAISKLNNKIF